MAYEVIALPFEPHRLDGLSDALYAWCQAQTGKA